MAKQDEPPLPEFLDNPHAPELFATAATGFFIDQGVVHVTFESMRVNHITSPGPVRRVVIGRLAMTVLGAQGLAVGLYDFLKKMEHDPFPPPDKNQIQ